MNEHEATKLGKALGDPNRVFILMILSEGEEIGCHLLERIAISQPTFSHHMKILCDSGLVNDRRDGKCHYYSINGERLDVYQAFLTSLLPATKV